MSNCYCEEPTEWVANISAGLDALPRQARSFADIRSALLRGVVTALPGWRVRDPQDLGVMWLELWAYIGDVLGFYDERIANESYLRTAVRSVSLRRHVALLGLQPKPGLAGSATVAAIADGRQPVVLPPLTAFRSAAFGSEAPQVYELADTATIDPLKNQWTLGAIKKSCLPEHTPTVGNDPTQSPTSPAGHARFLTFEPDNFGLAKDRFVVFTGGGIPGPGAATKVKNVKPFAGIDGRSYVEVEVDPPVWIPYGTAPSQVKALTPSVTARPTVNNPEDHGDAVRGGSAWNTMSLFMDSQYPQLSAGQLLLVANDSRQRYVLTVAKSVGTDSVSLPNDVKGFVSKVEVYCTTDIKSDYQKETFHFSFIDAGRVTVVGSLDLTAQDLASGVAVDGLVGAPTGAVDHGSTKLLAQRFLLRDADQRGALVEGTLRFDTTGRAVFSLARAIEPSTLGTLKAPVRVFGNVLDVTRGATVLNEVLGSGDPRIANQAFDLRQRPLTYLESAAAVDAEPQLKVFVEGELWLRVKSFYACGPDAHVYMLTHDDSGNTTVVFGDGKRGARVPSGVDNVVATYRFGAGRVAPPANSLEQIARGAPGLKGAFAPLPGREGRDPEKPEPLRKLAARSALLFGRLVSVRDFEVFVSLRTGVQKASAKFVWNSVDGRGGVVVSYIGTARPDELREALVKQSDPNLSVDVVEARPIPCSLQVDLGTHPDVVGDRVAAQAIANLTDPEQGILSPAQAELGGTLWTSRMIQALLSIPGAVEVVAAKLWMEGASVDLKTNEYICLPAGSYLDFSAPQSVTVNPAAPVGPVVDVRRLRGGC